MFIDSVPQFFCKAYPFPGIRKDDIEAGARANYAV